MNKQSKNHLTKAMIGLLMSCGTQALAQNTITAKIFIENKVDRSTVQLLLNEKILIKSSKVNEFQLNEKRVMDVLAHSEDPQVVEFLNWLKLKTLDISDIKIKKPKDMHFSTQDGGINQGN